MVIACGAAGSGLRASAARLALAPTPSVGAARADDDPDDVVLVAEGDAPPEPLLRPALRVLHRVARAAVAKDEEDLVVRDVAGRGGVRLRLERAWAARRLSSSVSSCGSRSSAAGGARGRSRRVLERAAARDGTATSEEAGTARAGACVPVSDPAPEPRLNAPATSRRERRGVAVPDAHPRLPSSAASPRCATRCGRSACKRLEMWCGGVERMISWKLAASERLLDRVHRIVARRDRARGPSCPRPRR